MCSLKKQITSLLATLCFASLPALAFADVCDQINFAKPDKVYDQVTSKISKNDTVTAKDAACILKKVQGCYFTKSSCFPKNFMKGSEAGGPLKITVKCRTMLLDYKTANDGSFGTAEVYVDGALVTTLEGNSSGGWNNNNVVLIIDEAEAENHTVEIKMADGSENKKFTVLSLAYN